MFIFNQVIFFFMKILIIIALLLAASCNSHNGQIYEVADGVEHEEFRDLLQIPDTEQPPPPQATRTSEDITKKVIKTGGIDFESENVERDYEAVSRLLPDFDAYIEHENQYKTSQRVHYSLTVRVPSSRYDSLFNTIAQIAFRLENKYSNVEDVTERYYDLKTRINNKQALEKRYLELLNEASEVKDMLEIEKSLNEIRTEIESMQGQFNFLSKQISLSTIQLSFYEILPYTYDSSQRKGFGARIVNALTQGWQGFITFLVAFISFWPFLILAAGGIYILKKVRLKRNRKDSIDQRK